MHVVLLSKRFQKTSYELLQPWWKYEGGPERNNTHPGPVEEEFFSPFDSNKFRRDKLFDFNSLGLHEEQVCRKDKINRIFPITLWIFCHGSLF